MTKENCGNCKFALPADGQPELVYCRRFPAQVNITVQGHVHSGQPSMNKTEGWCGEWKTRIIQ